MPLKVVDLATLFSSDCSYWKQSYVI